MSVTDSCSVSAMASVALIKLGLVPEGKIVEQKPDSPTLTYNTIGRHAPRW